MSAFIRSLLLGLALSGSFITQSAHAEDLAASIRSRLLDAPVIRGNFEQRKSIAGFRKPVVSRGDFLITKERGVLWQTREPFNGSLKLTRNEIVTRSGSEETMRLSASSQPGMQSVSRLLFALLSGDVQQLGENFTIQGTLRGAQGWQLQLVPKVEALSKLFSRIELNGDRYVRHVELFETSGDHTDIQLSALNSEPAALSPDEVKRFD